MATDVRIMDVAQTGPKSKRDLHAVTKMTVMAVKAGPYLFVLPAMLSHMGECSKVMKAGRDG